MSRCDKAGEERRIFEMLGYERALWERGVRHVAGIDEAGRGPLAGPVVAASVMFRPGVFIPGVNDSKKLSPRRREDLYDCIMETAVAVSTGIVHEQEIDRINILKATHKAMRISVGTLAVKPDHLLIDGRGLPERFFSQTAIEGGDRCCFSIAAASIIAKVTRDRMMLEYHDMFPEYGFARHKGYGTKEHLEAIRRHGRCPIHRRTFQVKGL
ncbi:ribonuclease HII [bacterium]|nr:ribonuclease HII [bacterium]